MSRASLLRRWARERRGSEGFNLSSVRKDAAAGAALGLVSVPDGLAAGLLAGVSPVAGLYGYLMGTVAGALSTSSVFMTVQATGAMGVLIADVPLVHGPDQQAALVTLAVLTGAIMLGLGLLKLGTLVRFVPNAVLTGFVNAVAVNIVLAQLADFTGFRSEAGNRLLRAADTLLNVLSFDWATFAVGLASVGLILLLERTVVGPLGLFLAVVITSGAVTLFGWDSVTLLRDVADVPSNLPLPVLPRLSLIPALLVPALSLAFVGLVQGAGISKSVPNPDGTYPDVSGDFRGQGVANIAAGLFQGLPVGGSMSATALVTEAGARSRLANLVAGAVMAIVILLFGSLAGLIAMPALAGLLILVGIRTFKPERVLLVWRTGGTQASVMATTFVLTLLIPLQYAVLVGVGISVVLYVARQSNTVRITRWTLRPGSPLPIEGPPPAELPAGEIVVLNVYGSLFFASAPVFEAQLPVVGPESTGSAVVVRLRGKEELGSTFIEVITQYVASLNAVGSHLILAGVSERVLGQLTQTGAIDIVGEQNVFPAEHSVGAAVTAGLERARELVDAAQEQSGQGNP